MNQASGIDTERRPVLSNGLPPDLPLLYEDDVEPDLGETNPHFLANEILHTCLCAHFANRPELRVYSDMNLYYLREEGEATSESPYISPDTMVVRPDRNLDTTVRSYQIGRDGPAPLVTIEVLSDRSAQQGDLREKMKLYAYLGVREYILIDLWGKWLPVPLVLKRLQSDKHYKEDNDADGGVTSNLGFRIVLETDGLPAVYEVKSARRYIRPQEAETRVSQAETIVGHAQARVSELEQARTSEAEARLAAEAKIRDLEAELARVRRASGQDHN